MNINGITRLIGMVYGTCAFIFPAIVTAEEVGATTSTHTFTPNLAIVNNYVFRGLTQTWNEPALQGGIDYNHADGWYASVWASNISDRQYAKGIVELDLGLGYNGKFTSDDWTWTIGAAGAYYPEANYSKVVPTVAMNGNQSYNNLEINGGIGYKWILFKLSAAVTDYFGVNTSNGYTSGTRWSTYSDLTATIPLSEEIFGQNVTMPLHAGYTNYTAKLASPTPSGGTNPDYADFKVGLAKGFDEGVNLSLAVTHATNNKVYNNTSSIKSSGDNINLGGTHIVVSLAKTF
ncbi:MAG: hypothetical protein HQL58_09885 [Magnetococcales bacterium]|nr:hypothetical protein [Magnetococcales bacterium]